MLLISLIILLFLQISGNVYAQSIVSQSQTIYQRSSTRTTLHCNIQPSFNFLDYIITWRKVALDITTPIANNKVLDEPFRSTSRFSVSVEAISNSLVNASLTITDLKLEDSGEYRCQLIHHQNDIISSVAHRIVVTESVKSVTIIGRSNGSVEAEDTNIINNNLMYYAQQSGFFSCVVVGGSPEPTVRVRIGSRLITANLLLNKTERIIGTVRGLQRKEVTINRYQSRFSPSATDGSVITCSATIRYGPQNTLHYNKTQSVNVAIFSAPVFDPNKCRDVRFRSPLGQTNFKIKCGFISSPAASVIEWAAVTTGQTVRSGNSVDIAGSNVQASNEVIGGGITATLEFQKISVDHFQTYRLKIQNSIGSIEREFTISLGTAATGSTTDAGLLISYSLSLLVSATAAALFLCMTHH